MIEVARFGARSRAAPASQFASHRHEIDQRGAGAELVEAEVLLHLLHRAAEHIDVEAHHRVEVGHPQNEVIQVLDPKHGGASFLGP